MRPKTDSASSKASNLPLTTRQRQVYKFIVRFIAGHGYPPSIRDVAAEFGFVSEQGAICHLKALSKKGYIRRTPGKCRAIQITAQPSPAA
jgi:repressor LexA